MIGESLKNLSFLYRLCPELRILHDRIAALPRINDHVRHAGDARQPLVRCRCRLAAGELAGQAPICARRRRV